MISITSTGISNSISNRRSTVAAFVLAAASLMFAGCADDSPVQSEASGLHAPAAGSEFIYRTRGTYLGGSVEYFDTVRVLQAGLTIGGRSNVIEMETSGPSEEYSYMTYCPNGDVSLAQYNGYRLAPGQATDDIYWVTFPLATRSMTSVNSPSTIEIGGVIQPSIVYEVRDNGTETVKDGGISIASEKFEVTSKFAQNGGAYIMTMNYWISASTGMPSKSKIDRDGMTEERVLVSQKVK